MVWPLRLPVMTATMAAFSGALGVVAASRLWYVALSIFANVVLKPLITRAVPGNNAIRLEIQRARNVPRNGAVGMCMMMHRRSASVRKLKRSGEK